MRIISYKSEHGNTEWQCQLITRILFARAFRKCIYFRPNWVHMWLRYLPYLNGATSFTKMLLFYIRKASNPQSRELHFLQVNLRALRKEKLALNSPPDPSRLQNEHSRCNAENSLKQQAWKCRMAMPTKDSHFVCSNILKVHIFPTHLGTQVILLLQ